MDRHQITFAPAKLAFTAMLVFASLRGTSAHSQCLDPGESPLECRGLAATCVVAPGGLRVDGTDGDDVIVGTEGRDLIYGGAGDDTICGRGGDDRLLGEDGEDTLDGGDGDDRILGGTGNDTVYGGAGMDTIFGQEGGDTLNGDAGLDVIRGGEGDDTLSGGDTSDNLKGGRDNDTLFGGDGSDELSGGRQRDTLVGGEGRDVMFGNAGSDWFVVDGEEDVEVFGGRGRDTLDLSEIEVPVSFDLRAPCQNFGLSLCDVTEIEDVNGTEFGDRLVGNQKRNLLRGNGGDDTLVGKGRPDILLGGPGEDLANGGPGLDSCIAETERLCEETPTGFVWERLRIEPAGPLAILSCVNNACSGTMTSAGSFKLDYVTEAPENNQTFSIDWRPPSLVLVPGLEYRLFSKGSAGGAGDTPFRVTFCYQSDDTTFYDAEGASETELCTDVGNNIREQGELVELGSDKDEPRFLPPQPTSAGEIFEIDARVAFYGIITYVYISAEN